MGLMGLMGPATAAPVCTLEDPGSGAAPMARITAAWEVRVAWAPAR